MKPAWLGEFLRFGVVGGGGFAVDAATVYLLRGALGLYAAMLLAYVAAASVNWAGNRLWTFEGRGKGPARRQWGRFIGANLLGLGLNRGTAIGLAAALPWCRRVPVIPLAAGAVAGMGVNFWLSRRYVFV